MPRSTHHAPTARELFLFASSEIEPTRAEERQPRRAALGDPRVGDAAVLELARLHAPELLEPLWNDRDRGPRLHRRTHRLTQASPESRERAFIESRRQRHRELEVVFEALA